MPANQTGNSQISALMFSTWDFPGSCDGDSDAVSLIDPTGKGKLPRPLWQLLHWSKPACHGHDGNTKNVVRPRFVEEKSPHDVSAFVSDAHEHYNVPCSVAFAKHFRVSEEVAGVKCTDLVVSDV